MAEALFQDFQAHRRATVQSPQGIDHTISLTDAEKKTRDTQVDWHRAHSSWSRENHDRYDLCTQEHRADRGERQGVLSDGLRPRAKASLRDHGCRRRRGAPRPEREIMIATVSMAELVE